WSEENILQDWEFRESNEKSASEKLQSWHTVYFPIDFESLGGDVENIGLFLTRCISQSSLLLPHQKFDETEDGCVTLSSPHQATAILRAYWKDKIFSTPSWKYAILPELAPLFCFEGLNCQVQLLLKCLQDSKTIESHPSCLTNLSIDPRTFSESPETLEWSTSDPQSIIPRQLLIRLHSLDPQNAAIASPSKGRALQSTSAPSSSSSSAALPSEKVQRASPISLIREGRVVKVEFLKSLTDSPLDLDHFQNLLVLPEDETFPNPRGHLDLEDALEEAPESRNGPLSFLRFKMMWHEETERIKQFLKQCIHSRELKWMMEAKYWRIPIDFAFEATKCILHMGGSIDESILHSVVQQMEDFGVLSSCENRFSSSLKKVITTAPFWGYQRLGLIIPPLFTSPTISTKGISLSEKSGKIEEQWIELHILPFNLQIPHLLKTEKLCTWSAERQVWLCSLTLLSTLAMKLCSPPLNFATATAKDRETLNILVDRLRPHRSSFHFSLPSKRFTSMNTRGPTYETTEKKSQNRGLAIKEVQKKSKLLIDSSSSGEDSDASSKKSISEDETVFHLSKMSKKSQNTVDFNTKMKFIIAGDPTAVKRISEKIQSVIRNVKPPRMGFTADGKLSSSAPGTGGFEIVGWPKSLQNWNFISFLVVPSAINKKIPIDTYHPKLLCSLVSEVFIIQEDAIDWLLKTFDRWPGPDERSHFEKWESIIKQYEPRQWGGNSFEVRQGLATSGLFADTEFFDSSSLERKRAKG
ncbi:hypothetical protein IE077_000975, partial [Cardiosporidium cionae]